MPMRIEWMLCMIQSLWFQRWAFAMMLPLAECVSLVRICVWSFGTVYQVQNLQLLSECNYSTEWIRFFYVFRPNRLTWLISGFWSRTTNNPKLNTRVYTVHERPYPHCRWNIMASLGFMEIFKWNMNNTILNYCKCFARCQVFARVHDRTQEKTRYF